MKKAVKEDPRTKEGDPPLDDGLSDPHEVTIEVGLDDLGLPSEEDLGNVPTTIIPTVERTRRLMARRLRGPQVDPGALTIESNIEIPPPREKKGRVSGWVPLLQKMKVGESVNVPNTTPARLSYIRAIAKKLNLSVVVRSSPDGARVWRVGTDSFEDGL